jgi:hypothetical protein
MAGDWIKMECCTPDKPEVLAITAKMGWDDPDLTVGKLFRMWRWFDQHTSDGNADSVTSALLDRIVGVTGFAECVCSVGWMSISETGVSIPNFNSHNGKTAKSRAQTAKRVSSYKSNAEGNGNANAVSVTGALPREEKRREENNKAASKNYAFQGGTIRITDDDFEKLKTTYPNLDIPAQLAQLDLELSGKKGWFVEMHSKLNYRNKTPAHHKNSMHGDSQIWS